MKTKYRITIDNITFIILATTALKAMERAKQKRIDLEARAKWEVNPYIERNQYADV
jgi:hypothetical protein